MHNGFVTVNDEKMSKSLENFFLLRDIYKKYDPLVIRWFLLTTSHYRAPLNYSEDMLEQSKHSLEKLKDFTRRLKEYDSDSLGYKNTIKMIKIYEKEFIKKRLELRKEKNWFEADKIREEIRSKGYNIDDSDGKSIIKRL